MQQPVDAAVLRDLAPNGVLRAAINFGNSVLAQRDAATGEARGVSIDLTHELARRLGAVPHLVRYDAAGKVVAAVKDAVWDVAFLAIDPARGAEMTFTPPYVLIEGAYLVRDDAALTSADDVDRPGTVVALGAGSAYDLFLTRSLKHAGVERSSTAMEREAIGRWLIHAALKWADTLSRRNSRMTRTLADRVERVDAAAAAVVAWIDKVAHPSLLPLAVPSG